MRQLFFRTLCSFIAAGFLTSCMVSREAKWHDAGSALRSSDDANAAIALTTAGDEFFKERDHQEKLEAALQKWQLAAEIAPSTDVYAKLARGHYLLADGFFALVDNDAERDGHFTQGLGFAEKALALAAPNVIADVKQGTRFSQAIKNAPKEAMASLYWYAANLSKWAASQGFVARLKYKDDVKSAMDRVYELDPGFFYAGPWRYFGAFEAVTAGLAGGDLKKSQHNFETATRLAPQYLGTKVLWAEYLCTRTQDRQTFEKLIKEVLAADPAIDAAIEPENRIEQQKAQKLLAKIDEHF